MKKTVFITGSSTGIGRECVETFRKNDWNVVATMRDVSKGDAFKKYSNVHVVKMDVTDSESIKDAVDKTIEQFGQIDVLINNAGYYSIGVVEAIDEAEIKRQLDTNLLGLILTTKEVLPHMRKRKSGLIVNMSSVAGRSTVLLQSIYHASKWGVEGFSQSLKYEVEDMGIDVVLIEPGVIKTDFYNRSMQFSKDKSLVEYEKISESVGKYLIDGGNEGSAPEEVAEKIFDIATKQKRKLQYVVGKSTQIVLLQKLLPVTLYRKIVKSTMIK